MDSVQYLSSSSTGYPRAAGIPTGVSAVTKGFPFMDDSYIRQMIDISLERIVVVLYTYHQLRRVVYSCDPTRFDLIGYRVPTV